MRKVTFNDVWEMVLSETTPTILPTAESHYCKKGLHNLSLPETHLNGRCKQCRRDREMPRRQHLSYQRYKQRLIKRIREKRDKIRILEAELDRILYEQKI